MDSVVEARGISKFYRLGKIKVPALKHIDLKVPRGEFLCIMGPSGSGKTTLLNLLGLLDDPSAGEIIINNQSSNHLTPREAAHLRSHYLGFVFQSFNLFPMLNAFENVEYPLLFKTMAKSERKERAIMALHEVGLEAVAFHRPDELSGGQRQRVAIARAMVTRPVLILADEPTANLDSESAETVIEAMKRLAQAHNTSFIFSTHDPRITNHAHRILRIKDGEIHHVSASEANIYSLEKRLSE
jgi:putative ABC transport system ATP-binding protein